MSFELLFKFGKKEHLQELQKGNLYMNNVKYFIDLEKERGKGIGDKYDSQFFVQNAAVSAFHPISNELIFTGKASYCMETGLYYNPIFCLMCMDQRNKVREEEDGAIIVYELNEKIKEKIRSNFDDYVLFISEPDAFINLIEKKASQLNLKVKRGIVKYYTPNVLSVDRYSAYHNGENIAFYKIYEDFSYQQEYRILIQNKQTEKAYEDIKIGNISKITKLMKKEDFLNLIFRINAR